MRRSKEKDQKGWKYQKDQKVGLESRRGSSAIDLWVSDRTMHGGG